MRYDHGKYWREMDVVVVIIIPNVIDGGACTRLEVLSVEGSCLRAPGDASWIVKMYDCLQTTLPSRRVRLSGLEAMYLGQRKL